MVKREYYSIRKGLIKDPNIDFEVIKKMFLTVYRKFLRDGYFQRYFGLICTDGDIEGELGPDIETIIFINLKKPNLWPVITKISTYTEEDFFDVVEFLHDYSSYPVESTYHSWNDCGIHVTKSDDAQGQLHFRNAVNPILGSYNDGYEIGESGEILTLPEEGFQTLLSAEVITTDENNIKLKVSKAILKFRKAKSTEDERRDALRDLADVLEFLKDDLKKVLPKQDEKDLFNIANNFAIRHHNTKQKTDYDKAIWHSWIFYSYLSTIHLVTRLVNR